MEKVDELQRVLDAETPEEIFGIAAERIKELNNSVVEKDKKIGELEKKVEAKKLADTKERFLKEKEELQEKIAEQKAKNVELDKEEKRLQGILQDPLRPERKLFRVDAPESEIGKLKLARMNIYQRAHGLTEDNNPRLLGNRSVVVDSAPQRKLLCYDGADEVIDELKAKRMRIFEDSRAK